MTLALSFYSRSGTWRCLRSLNASCLSNLIDTDVLGLFIYFDQIQNIFFQISIYALKYMDDISTKTQDVVDFLQESHSLIKYSL